MPLVPYSRVPLLIALGAVQDAPVVEDGEIVVGKTMRVFATFDHRVLDGANVARFLGDLERTLTVEIAAELDQLSPTGPSLGRLAGA